MSAHWKKTCSLKTFLNAHIQSFSFQITIEVVLLLEPTVENFFRGKKPMTAEFFQNVKSEFLSVQFIHWNRKHFLSTFSVYCCTEMKKFHILISKFSAIVLRWTTKKKKKKRIERNEKNRVGGGPSFISAYPSPIHRATKVIHPKCYKHWGLLMLINILVGKLLYTEIPVLCTVIL